MGSFWTAFIGAFVGTLIAAIFIAVCVLLGFGPDQWIAFMIQNLPAGITPNIARIAFITLGLITATLLAWPKISALWRRLLSTSVIANYSTLARSISGENKADNPFTSQWPLAPAVIDYIALSLGISQDEACIALQRQLLDGRLERADRSTKSASATAIDSEFWRFALPNWEGDAFNCSTLVRLPWFEVCANDVVATWPANRKATE